MIKKLLVVALLGLATASVSACIRLPSKQTTTVKATTTGQELTDLQTAFDAGLIDQKEYDARRKKILKE